MENEPKRYSNEDLLSWFDGLEGTLVNPPRETAKPKPKPPRMLGAPHPLQVAPLPKGNGKGKLARRRKKLWQLQGGLCAYCDRVLETFDHGTLDHVKPKWRGGPSTIENLRLVCHQCNSLKAWFSSYKEAKEFTDTLLAFFERLKERGIITE